MPLSYVIQALSPGEKVVHCARFHWFYDVVSWFWLVVGFMAGAGVIAAGMQYVLTVDMEKAFPNIQETMKDLATGKIVAHYGGWLGLIQELHWLVKTLAAMCFFWGAYQFLHRMVVKYTTEIAVTTQRLIYKRGVVARFSGEMKLDRIEGVNVWQSFFGRIFNYGRLAVHGIGVGEVALPEIEDPLKFRKALDYAKAKMNEPREERSEFDRLQNPVDNNG